MYVSNGSSQQLADEAVAILESISDGFFSVNADWEFVYLNQRAEHLLGVGRAQVVGQTIWNAFPGLAGTAFETVYRDAMRAHAPAEVTSYYPEHATWYEVRIAPIAGGLSFYFRDVGAQVETQQALHESERNFRQLAESIPQIVWIVEASGRGVYFNHQWEAYTGVPIDSTTPADVTGQFVHPDDRDATMAAWKRAYERHAAFAVEHRIRSKAGDYRWFLVRAEPFQNEAGQIERWFGTSTDIHDEKLAQIALAAAERRHAFQLALADRIRPLVDPGEVTAAACELLGRHVGGKRVVFGEADETGTYLSIKRDWTDGSLASMAGMRLRLDDFGSAVADVVRAGSNLVLDDVLGDADAAPHAATYLASGIRAALAIPLVKEGCLRAVLNVHDDAVHPWTLD
ncbi:MAG: hypothetical protein C0489_10335, partial [Candidatus Accumulibacter sp.]|nr:hypothetical protein [Accumulibacter sp.]